MNVTITIDINIIITNTNTIISNIIITTTTTTRRPLLIATLPCQHVLKQLKPNGFRKTMQKNSLQKTCKLMDPGSRT